MAKTYTNFQEKIRCSANFQTLLSKYKSPVVIQKFIEKVKYGDKRVILVNGKAVGAVNRIPKSGAFKANLHLGGTPRNQATK